MKFLWAFIFWYDKEVGSDQRLKTQIVTRQELQMGELGCSESLGLQTALLLEDRGVKKLVDHLLKLPHLQTKEVCILLVHSNFTK